MGRMTVAELDALPENERVKYELHSGGLVQLTYPKMGHTRMQYRFRRLLEPIAADSGVVDEAIAFHALPEYEFRFADVAFVRQERWDQADPDDNLRGAPDLVIEVIDSSDLESALAEKQRLCLDNGSQEFWVAYPTLRLVKASKPDGTGRTYLENDEIPLALLGGGTLPVKDVFV